MTRFALTIGCALVTTTAFAGWPAPFSSDVPPELRPLFVEAAGEFELKTLRNMPEPLRTGIYWIDNHRVIYTVRTFNGWKARDVERSKIVVYDVDTGKSEETTYRGNLTCFGPDGQMLVQDYPLPHVGFVQPGDTKDDTKFFLIGTFGQPLTRFKRPKEHGMVDSFSCQPYSNADHDFGAKHISIPLHRGDGVLDKSIFDAQGRNVRFVSPEGKTQWSIETNKFCNEFGRPQYLPWVNHYFVSTAFGNIMPGCPNSNKDSWLFSSTAIETKPLPKLIQEARKYGSGLAQSGETYWARPGMFILIDLSAGILDGLYWNDERSGKLKRVLKKPWGLALLSPDGCRNLVMVNPPTIIELCKGKTQ